MLYHNLNYETATCTCKMFAYACIYTYMSKTARGLRTFKVLFILCSHQTGWTALVARCVDKVAEVSNHVESNTMSCYSLHCTSLDLNALFELCSTGEGL